MQSIYSVEDEFRAHADYVLERFAAKQCKNMMYELRVDAVKKYYDDYLLQPIKDKVACKKLLREAQYLKVQPDWISEEAWHNICAYWCSTEYKRKRLLAQESRNQLDFAQNRGGSRPYGQTKQYLVSYSKEFCFTRPYNFADEVLLLCCVPLSIQPFDLISYPREKCMALKLPQTSTLSVP
jgi:hypothetical protein